jgi:hypothetical protein
MKFLLAVYVLFSWGSGAAQAPVDPRELYDEQTYRIDLGVDPERDSISGFVPVEAVVTGPSLGELTLDMHASLSAREVRLVEGPPEPDLPLAARERTFRREGDRLHCVLPAPRERGERVTVQVLYTASPSGAGSTAEQAYSSSIYNKGGAVPHTLRHYLDDDETWWALLRGFHAAHRYGNAGTEDFRAALEKATSRDWKPFFDEWAYGVGHPRLVGRVRAEGERVAVDNPVQDTAYHVPLDLVWTEAGNERRERLWLDPGDNRLAIECAAPPGALRVVHVERLLGKHDVRVD